MCVVWGMVGVACELGEVWVGRGVSWIKSGWGKFYGVLGYKVCGNEL